MRGGTRGLLIVLGVLVVIALLGPLLGGWGMMGPGMMWGAGWPRGAGWDGRGVIGSLGLWMALGWLSMLAFWGAVVLGVVLLVRALAGGGRPANGAPPRADDPALEILRRRYAAGEITREQYEQMRADLEREPVGRR